MKRLQHSLSAAGLFFLLVLLASEVNARGFGARGGGFKGGGFRTGCFSGGGFRTGSVGHFGGTGFNRGAGKTIIGPSGGGYSKGYKGGSYTTPGGTNIKYGAGGKGYQGPLGGGAGRYVGGAKVTTPSGQSYYKGGKGGGVYTPGGYGVGGKKSIGVTTGPKGTGVGVSKGGVAVGPYKSFGTKYKGGVAVGPYGGVAAGGKKGFVGTRPGGTVVGGSGFKYRSTGYRTHYVSGSALRTQAGYVRTGFRYYGAFTPAWYARYPRVWRPVRWVVPTVWAVPTWTTVYNYCSYPAQPIYYDYGTTVVYQGDTVYVNGVQSANAEEYAQQATEIANTGKETEVPKEEEWQPLGVFAMVEGDAKTSYDIFQLAIDKNGIIRGNYYNALSDTTQPLYGSVDKKNQRAAWTVGDKKFPVYEAGIANLTKDETTMLVHFDEDRSQQFLLVRLEQPEEN